MFIKKILKKTLPAPLLKQAFLVVNKIKIHTIDRVLFPEYKINTNEFLIYRNGFPFRESEINLGDLHENEVKTYMMSWYDWTQEEFLLVLNKPCWIEPDYGWAIVEPNKLVYYSLGVSRTLFQKKPSVFRFLRKKNIVRVSKAISLRDTGEENYFHFYNDVINKLFFLEQHGIDVKGTSVIISKKLWDKNYFQFYYTNSNFLKSLTWIVQKENQYIHCDSVIFCKPLTHRKDLWTSALTSIKELPTSSGNRKIFLTRSKTRLRFIENMEEIETIFIKLGFTVVDTDNLSLREQVALFSSTEFLVGIHGAGLTNMAFRKENCHVLELFPPPDLGYLPYHYIMLAKMSGFQYTAMIGETGRIKYSGGFYLNAEQFEKTMVSFIGKE